MLSCGFGQKPHPSASLCGGCHLLTDLSILGGRKPKNPPPEPCSCKTETPELFAVHCVWKNLSGPHTRPAFQTGENNFHPLSHKPPPVHPPHTAHRGQSQGHGPAQDTARLGLVEAEKSEVEERRKLRMTEPGRVEQEGNRETQWEPDLQISENWATAAGLSLCLPLPLLC